MDTEATETEPSDTEKPIAYDAYQKLAEHYSAKIDTKPHNAFYDRPAMLSLLPDVNGKSVLDAGCGPGAYAEELVRRGATVSAFDISEKMLEQAQKRLASVDGPGSVEFHLTDMLKPMDLFGDSTFDVVIAPLCLDYIKDWTKLFLEFHRVLKPGGQFLFSVGHPASDAEYFDTDQYFSVEQVSCTWHGFGPMVRMQSYRRSLEEVFRPIMESGLIVKQVHEPLPNEDFKNADLRRYKRLMHRPCFICIVTEAPDN